jgi:outer membrane biosynthesis protein TonB
MIILRGEIGEDGKPQNLEVFRGLSPEMDAAAQLAFSRWTFRPAMRSGKPVSVQILWIPAEEGKTPPAVSREKLRSPGRTCLKISVQLSF